MTSRFLFIIFSWAAAFSACAQSKAQIFPEMGSNLYWGIDNPVQVIYQGRVLKPGEYEATLERGTCRKTDTALIVYSAAMGGPAYLCIKSKSGDTIYFGHSGMTTIPTPVLALDGKLSSGKISKERLLASAGLVALLPNFKLPVRLYVKSFLVTFHTGNETFSLICSGPKFSKPVIAAIKRLRPYDRMEITDIKLDPPWSGHSMGGLPPMVFEIDKYYPGASYRRLVSGLENELPASEHPGDINYDSLNQVLQVPSLQYEDSLLADKEIKTNCNNRCDSCSLNVFYWLRGTYLLAERYEFTGEDSVDLKWYDKSKLLADIHYLHGEMNGPFILYYPSGTMRMKGSIKQVETTGDTIKRPNPVTLKEESVSRPGVRLLKEGKWEYFNFMGTSTKMEFYKDGKLVKD